MTEVRWDRYPTVASDARARTWLTILADLGRAPNTIDAYGRGLEEFLRFSHVVSFQTENATRAHVAAYVRELTDRPSQRVPQTRQLGHGRGLSNATMQQRLTVVRLFYDYLIEEGVRANNPVGRGKCTPGTAFGRTGERGLLPRYQKLPWIPGDDEWTAVLTATREEPVRNQLMLSLAYDGALRREEVCTLQSGDLDPAHRQVRIRAEVTKSRRERLVRYTPSTGQLLREYLSCRRTLDRSERLLFLSESRRNRGHPISIWSWSKIVEGLARRAGLPQFTTHTPRHLRLTDLARADMDIHEIAAYAGHRSIQTTLLYIHLSGRELAGKYDRAMEHIRRWRTQLTDEESN
jgi:site-specific recombinase XerD